MQIDKSLHQLNMFKQCITIVQVLATIFAYEFIVLQGGLLQLVFREGAPERRLQLELRRTGAVQ